MGSNYCESGLLLDCNQQAFIITNLGFLKTHLKTPSLVPSCPPRLCLSRQVYAKQKEFCQGLLSLSHAKLTLGCSLNLITNKYTMSASIKSKF